MGFEAFEQEMHGFLRAVEARGLGGQDAEVLAASLAEHEALGNGVSTGRSRASVGRAVGHFRRAEARRRAVQEEAARIAGWAQRWEPGIAGPEERRAFIAAIRKARESLTDPEAAMVAAAVLAESRMAGSRRNAPLILRVGRLVLRSLRRNRDEDTAFLTDPRCVRILLAGMRMWLRGSGAFDGKLRHRD